MSHSEIDMMDMLPKEVVEIILSAPSLSPIDVLNFGATCKYFHDLVHQNGHIWKNKFLQRYPQFFKLFDNYFMDWYAELLYIHDLRKRTHALLSTMSPRFYKLNELSECDFAEWYVLTSETPRTYHYIVFDLLSILNDNSPIRSITVVPIDTPGNKTFQYYASKALRCIRQKHLTTWWEEFTLLPESEQILEKGAFFVAQWCQPHSTLEYEDIAMQLDNIAKEVIKELPTLYPNHPLLKVSDETLLLWKLHNLDANQWNVVECQQLMQCLRSVLYINNKFTGNTTDYYTPKNSYIDQVLSLKTGLPITLAVIFESVARRIGLKCDPYAFPSHFLLKFTEGKGEANSNSYYIDVFKNGNPLQTGTCPRKISKDLDFVNADAQQVVERMANNVLNAYRHMEVLRHEVTMFRSALELIRLVNPENIEVIRCLGRLYMEYSIDIQPLQNFLFSDKFQSRLHDRSAVRLLLMTDYNILRKQKILEAVKERKSKTRPENLEYAVGMIVRNTASNIHCVIYDWDSCCLELADYEHHFGSNELKYGKTQPFYKVILADGTHYYAAQEFLTSDEQCIFDFSYEIGKHFSHFFETHYVPNAEKEKEYADDAKVRHMFHQQIKFSVQGDELKEH